MPDRHADSDDVFAERLARVLGAPERFGEEFERSLVAAIQADRPIRWKLRPRARLGTAAWWRTPATLRLSPLAGLALAAGLAMIATLGTMRVARPTPNVLTPVATVAAAPVVHDTVTLVRFVFVGQAKTVSVVGDFNQWGATPTPLEATSNGAWTASIPLANGRHEYAFIVNGTRWVPDPLAPVSSDEFDTKSSIVTVGL